jgi:cytochrome c biogenesis protein CcmG/thiol:disulfide interchange protein DsbE
VIPECMLRALLIVVCFGLVASCESTKVGPQEGQHAPQFQAAAMNGGNLRLDAYSGKPILLVFWASWCGPCRVEAPQVQRVASDYGDRVQVLGVNAGEDLSTARRAAAEMGIAWPVAMDADGAVRASYAVSAIPMVLIIDKNGVVRHRNNGVPSDVHRLLDGLLG